MALAVCARDGMNSLHDNYRYRFDSLSSVVGAERLCLSS